MSWTFFGREISLQKWESQRMTRKQKIPVSPTKQGREIDTLLELISRLIWSITKRGSFNTTFYRKEWQYEPVNHCPRERRNNRKVFQITSSSSCFSSCSWWGTNCVTFLRTMWPPETIGSYQPLCCAVIREQSILPIDRSIDVRVIKRRSPRTLTYLNSTTSEWLLCALHTLHSGIYTSRRILEMDITELLTVQFRVGWRFNDHHDHHRKKVLSCP